MNKNIYLYYCLNKDIKKVRTLKSGTKCISIVKIPEHISIKILRNITTIEGVVYPYESKYVSFPEVDKQLYYLVYSMLFPKVNYSLALCHVENKIEVIRNISIAIIKKTAKEIYFDDWLKADQGSYLCLRPPK